MIISKYKHRVMSIDLTIKEEHINESFKRIAFDLMNKWLIKMNSKLYRIAEIEFYNDVYTHGHPLQKEKEKWYFHGSGVDITFGTNRFHGGILIRAIYEIRDYAPHEMHNYVYGPLNCVTEIFSNINSVYNANISFGLVPSEVEFKSEIPIAAPRFGLNAIKDPIKYNALYRFLIMPTRKHAEKTKIAESMKLQGYSNDEIKNIWA